MDVITSYEMSIDHTMPHGATDQIKVVFTSNGAWSRVGFYTENEIPTELPVSAWPAVNRFVAACTRQVEETK